MEGNSRSCYRYAIVGTGALGGFYGARLQRAGAEVHFLARSDYDTIQTHGLRIESPDGDFTLPQVSVYRDASQMPRCEVVIVALKATQNAVLPTLLPSILAEDGVVLVLQNGLGIEPVVAGLVGPDRVMGGLCFICSNKVGAGHIRHLDYKKISLGDYGEGYSAQGITPRMKAIAQDFERAGIPIELEPDLFQARWKKLVWNIPFNGLSVVLDATTDAMMADASTLALIEHLMHEVVDGARSVGREIPQSFIHTMLDHTRQMKPYRTSMKIDYDENRPLELGAIFGNPLHYAQQAGVQLPQIQMLYQQLQFLNRRNRQSHH